MLVLAGPSASGKTEIAKLFIDKYNFKKLVTYTTRPPRIGEINGIDYNFVSVNEFIKMKTNNEFIETTYYNNNYYGSRKSDIGPNKVVILEPSGVNVFKKCLGDKIVIVYLNTPEDLRIKRMVGRGDKESIIESRIINDRNYFTTNAFDHIDYSYKNGIVDLEVLTKQIFDAYKNHDSKNELY